MGGGLLALLLFFFFASGSQIAFAAEEESVILETLKIEAEAGVEKQTLDLEQSFEESFIREKVFSEKIEEESIPDIKSALKDMPNVTVRESGAYTKTIEIRGLSGDRVIAIIDDVRIANQGMTHTGGGEVNLIDISTVESIEVIKGSPAVIYDPGATGGIIKVETKEISEEDHLKLKTTFAYDDGTEKTKEGITLSGSKYGLGLALSYSQTDANAYKVKNQAKLDAIILRTNEQENRTGTPFEIKNLGFEEESLSLNLGYRINPDHKLSFQYSDYEAADISFTHGAVDSLVFRVDALTRKTQQARYKIEDLGILQELSLTYANQELTRRVGEARSLLESKSVNLSSSIPVKNTILSIGGEFVADEADTQVFSNQDYAAGYVSAEHVQGDFSYLAGVRANWWKAQAKLPAGRDPAIVNDLVNVEGQFNPETGEFEDLNETAFTYATGVVYAVNARNKLSLNYSKTHRFSSLFERFAFGGFTGGGLGLKAEQADNFEAAWKYYNGFFFASFSVFQSDFDNYITLKQRVRIIDQAALEACIRQGDCDPTIGEYDGREDEFFAGDVAFFNVKQVINRGFEFSLKRIREDDYEAGFNFGLNDFEVRDVYDPTDRDVVITDANPLEFSFYYKRYLSDWTAKPWFQLKGRYVTDTPRVKQTEGFSPFFVADFFAGLKHDLFGFSDVAFNLGIRNLTDEVYHEPFSALDGLKRSYFFNVSVEIG